MTQAYLVNIVWKLNQIWFKKMNAKQILINLNQKELNFSVIAEVCNTSTSHVSNVAHRKTTSRKIAEAISIAIEIPLEEVFPEYKLKRLANLERAQRIKALSKAVNS